MCNVNIFFKNKWSNIDKWYGAVDFNLYVGNLFSANTDGMKNMR